MQLPPSSQLRNPRPPGRGLFFAPAASRVSLPLAIPPRKEPRLLEMILSAAALAGTAAISARGYVAVEAIGVNRVWIHRDEAALLARASAMSSHHVF